MAKISEKQKHLSAKKNINVFSIKKINTVNKDVLKTKSSSKRKSINERVMIIEKPDCGLIQINNLVVPYVKNKPDYMLGNENFLSDIYIPASFSSMCGLKNQNTYGATTIQVNLIDNFFKTMLTSNKFKNSIAEWNNNRQLVNFHESIVKTKMVPFIKRLDLETKNVVEEYEKILKFKGGLLSYNDQCIPYLSYENKILAINTQFNSLTANKFETKQYIIRSLSDSFKEYLKFLSALLMGCLEVEYKCTDKFIDITTVIQNNGFQTTALVNRYFPGDWKVEVMPGSSVNIKKTSARSETSPSTSEGRVNNARMYRVLFQKDFKEKIEQYKKHYANLDQLAYVVVQSMKRKEDFINYPVRCVKNLKLETRNRKKILFIKVEFEGFWSEHDREMWCTHSNVAASDLIEEYMKEKGLDWQVDFKGYEKREKKCYVDEDIDELKDLADVYDEHELKKRLDKYMKTIS